MPGRGDAASTEDGQRLALERTVAKLRAAALVFAVAQTGIQPGDDLIRSWITVALLAVGALSCAALVFVRPTRERVRFAGSVGMAFDAAICTSILFNNLTDPADVIWVIVFLPLIEAALRWSVRGGIAAGVGFGAVTAAWSAGVAHTAGTPLVGGHLSLRAGVIALVGGFLGMLVSQLAGERRALQQVLRLTHDLMLTVDDDGFIVDANEASMRLLGLEPSELVGRRLRELVVDLPDDEADALEEAGAGHRGAPAGVGGGEDGVDEPLVADGDMAEHPFRRADGSVTWLELAASRDAEYDLVYVVARDVTEKREAARQLVHQAYTDPVTGVANRIRLMEQMEQHLAARGHSLGLLFVDLDRFKMVNDTLGHSGGDDLLRAVVGRLRGCVRGRDLVARFAGDEFCVLLPDIASPAEALEVAERIVGSLGAPYEVGGAEVIVSASVGVALAQPLDTTESLLLHADQAMYRAKQLGRNRAVIHDASTRVFGGHVIESLKEAIAGDQLCLHYQPIVEMDTGRPVGVEALVRWEHPDEGLLDPVVFLGAAEDAGLAIDLGRWVLGAATAQLVAWDEAGIGGGQLELSVNVSGVELSLGDLSSVVSTALDANGIDPRRLVLDVAEGAVLADPDLVRPLLVELDATGVRIAIDDFGTGYSSMRLLQTVPASFLKVDRSFVSSIVPGSSDEAIVRSVVRLGRALGVAVVAEGVETGDQLELLRSLGCHRAQGFHLGPPLPAAEAAAFLSTWQSPSDVPGISSGH